MPCLAVYCSSPRPTRIIIPLLPMHNLFLSLLLLLGLPACLPCSGSKKLHCCCRCCSQPSWLRRATTRPPTTLGARTPAARTSGSTWPPSSWCSSAPRPWLSRCTSRSGSSSTSCAGTSTETSRGPPPLPEVRTTSLRRSCRGPWCRSPPGRRGWRGRRSAPSASPSWRRATASACSPPAATASTRSASRRGSSAARPAPPAAPTAARRRSLEDCRHFLYRSPVGNKSYDKDFVNYI